jgi:hypothetical protein
MAGVEKGARFFWCINTPLCQELRDQRMTADQGD